jgi:hypothetical protein
MLYLIGSGASQAGSNANNQAAALTSMSVAVDIVDFVATCIVEQTYQNHMANSASVEYSFRLPESVVLSAFRATFTDGVIDAVVKEKANAAQVQCNKEILAAIV